MRLLLRSAVLVVVHLGADALADPAVVLAGSRVVIDVPIGLLVVVLPADLVLAGLDYLGDPLTQAARIDAPGCGRGYNPTAADRKRGHDQPRSTSPCDSRQNP